MDFDILSTGEVLVVESDNNHNRVYRYNISGVLQGTYDLAAENVVPRGITYNTSGVYTSDVDIDTSRRSNTMYIGFLTVQAQEKGFTGNEPLALAAVVGMYVEVRTDINGKRRRVIRSRYLRGINGEVAKPKYYGHRDTDALFTRLNEFDLVVGHNLVDYGYLILEKYYDASVTLHADLPTFDLFTTIEDELGIRVKLASLAESVGMHRKANGLTDC